MVEAIQFGGRMRESATFLGALVVLCAFLVSLRGCQSAEESTMPPSNENTLQPSEEAAQPSEETRLVNKKKTKYAISCDVSMIPGLVAVNGVTVDLIEVGPWVNRMPASGGPEGEDEAAKAKREAKNRHLVATAVLRNGTENELQVELLAAFISFNALTVGDPVEPGGLSLIDETGMPSGQVKTVLAASEPKKIVRFRGSGLYGVGHDNEILYLTLILRVGDSVFRVRRGGNVVLAM